MLKLYYEGTDMTGYVNIARCVYREASVGRADSLEIEVDHAAQWAKWKPKRDDVIAVKLDGYSTGKLYLNSLIPEGERYRIIATSLPSAAQRRAWQYFKGAQLSDIMHCCALECGMDSHLYGLDGDYQYEYMLRQDEGCAAFLDRIGRLEGLAVKAKNGMIRAISVPWAQQRDAAARLRIDTVQPGVRHTVEQASRLSSVTVVGPGISATARDSLGEARNYRTIALPVSNAAQAGRWARGTLLMENRKTEQIEIKSAFNAAMRAMVRVDIEGNTQATGQWIVEGVEQDFIDGRTVTTMVRCVDTVD